MTITFRSEFAIMWVQEKEDPVIPLTPKANIQLISLKKNNFGEKKKKRTAKGRILVQTLYNHWDKNFDKIKKV